ncbi:MAG: RecX family transcriptional regulator, partial [Actinobacteria bacterium]|nr:RecX family transcriptional regulator [Actinomycetota bacterium]
KGVDNATVEAVTAGFADDEEERARELAERRAARMGGLDKATAQRRLTDFLIRRGHSPSTAREAASRALALDVALD